MNKRIYRFINLRICLIPVLVTILIISLYENKFKACASEYDIVTDSKAEAVRDCMVKLTWDYSHSEIEIEKFQYLIYRSESLEGDFVKIGYTQKGVKEYVDAGGDTSLEEGKTYYYKIQAYAPTENISSNLYFADVVSATPVESEIPENEFVLEDEKSAALEYLNNMINSKENTIEISIWLNPNDISGYASTLFEEAMGNAEGNSIVGYNSSLTVHRITRNGLGLYTISYEVVYKSDYDIVENITAETYGNCMIKLTWSYDNETVDASEIQYLIYRSETENGEYKKVGYTQFNVQEYIDAGGDTSLTNGKTYYYKIQAYAPKYNLSSNLYYTDSVNVTAQSEPVPENEFIIENEKDKAVEYIKNNLVNRNDEIEINIWMDEDSFAGYSKVLFDAAVLETENVDNYNSGDYLYLHLTGYDCDYNVNRIIRDGLNRYTLIYKPTYYSTKAEETELEQIIDDVINNEFEITDETSDFEKVRKVYEYLSHDASYDLSLKENGLSRCSAYDAIVEKKAVCQGYSNAAYIFLKKLGINNRIILGDVYYDGEWRVHAWNLVEIDNEWYNVCITTEVHMREEYNVLSYRYLLKTNEDKYFSIFRRNDDYSSEDFIVAHPMTSESYNVTTYDENLKAPKLTVTPKSGVTMSLSWTAVSGATYYEIYRSDSIDGEYKKVKETNSLSTSDTGLTAGNRYYYKIRTVKKVDTVIKKGALSTATASVALATPTISSAVVTENGVLLTWSKASGADCYNVYRYNSATGNYDYIKSVVGKLQYLDTTVQPGNEYYYKVRPYKKYDGVVYYSKYSSAKQINIKLVPSIDASPKSGVTMRLSWGNVEGATSYDVYYKSPDAEQFVYVKSTTSNSTSHTGLLAGQLYEYKIVAKDSAGAIAVSDVDKAVTLATPTVTLVENTVDGVHIRWTKASGADRYNIYRSPTVGGKYEYIESVQNILNYTDSTAESGKTYYYKIRPYKRVDGAVYYGGYSENTSIVCVVAPVLSATPKSGVTMSLSWVDPGESGYYEIYYSTERDGEYTYLKTTTGTNTSHTELTAGTLYYYKIRSFIIVNNEREYSSFSNLVDAVTLARPNIQTVDTSEDGTTLTWSKASGADRYNIYRCTSENGSYEYVESVQRVTTYTDTENTTGVYYYRVRAYKKIDGKVYYGQYSYPEK